MKLRLKELLNTEQYEAASVTEGPLLIIAGAGSGKTRMITYRIAHLLELGIPQRAVLALTFTNKAAKEMEERVSQLLGKPAKRLTVSTFHAFGLQVIKRHGPLLGFRGNITVFDTQDVQALIKESAREAKISLEELNVYDIAGRFSQIKSGLASLDKKTAVIRQLYEEYQSHLRTYQAVDFDDLIALPLELFSTQPEVLEEYRERFRHILVDEFQDTSRQQYQLLRMIALGHRNICVVGDDDQSIYSWRGANYENITDFETDFPEVREIKLEQNYRCTGNILTAANHLIANNAKRKVKALWTGEQEGLPLYLRTMDTESDEAGFMISKIREMKRKNRWSYGSFGILVRTNSLMNSIEHELVTENIPYSVSGGQSFFARKEVKDVIAYLRVLANPHNDIDLLRVINTPRRGLGKSTIDHLHRWAEKRGSSLYSAARDMISVDASPLTGKAKGALEELLSLLDETSRRIKQSRQMAEVLKNLLEVIEYRLHLLAEHPKNEQLGRWKYDNVLRFLQFFSQWEQDPDTGSATLYDYLNRISLSGKQEPDLREGRISLMTIHASKGLEFDCVFLPAVEEEIIPHGRSIEEDPASLEEERRLFYVALTRARQAVFISSCRTRKYLKGRRECLPSPFLEEIPKELFSHEETDAPVSTEEARDFFSELRKKLS